MGHNRENFGALLKSIIGNLKSIIGSGLAGNNNNNKHLYTNYLEYITKGHIAMHTILF